MFQTELFQKNMNVLKERYKTVTDPLFRFDRLLQEYLDTHEIEMQPYYSVPAEQVELWGRGFENQIETDRIFFIYGFMDGQCIRKLLELSDESNTFCIYEPELERFLLLMSTVDLSDILRECRVCLVLREINDKIQLQDYVIKAISYQNYRMISWLVMPGYQEESELCRQFYGYIQYAIGKVELNKATNLSSSKYRREHFLSNIPMIIQQYSMEQLVRAMKAYDVSNIPAFLVAAGPSLDKNVQELKKAKGHGMIVVVDTALKAVLRAGIRPDLTICVDPCKEAILFEHEEIKNIPAVLIANVPPAIPKNHLAKQFFCEEEQILSGLVAEYGKPPYGGLGTGGSVANSAYSLLQKMGFQTIILVGQDLAYTGGRGHNKDAYDDEEKNRNDALGKKGVLLCEVEGIDGQPVTTEVRMKSYREWFENMIKRYPEVHVLNATEGGAMIHGSENVTLRNAVETYCTETVFDFNAILNEIPPLLSKEEQETLRKEFLSLPQTLSELQAELRQGIAAYRQMVELTDQNKAVPAELLDTITKVNQIDQKNLWMMLVQKYTKEDEYELFDSLYGDKTDELDVRAVSENAVKLLNAYIEGIDALKQDLHLVTDQFAS